MNGPLAPPKYPTPVLRGSFLGTLPPDEDLRPYRFALAEPRKV